MSRDKAEPTYAELRQQLAKSLQREREKAAQQSTTSEIPRIVARFPADVQQVLNTIADNAARLCDAENATILRIDGDVFTRAAVHGSKPHSPAAPPINRETPQGRAVIEKRTIHVPDLAAEAQTEYPGVKGRLPVTRARTYLVTPLLRDDIALGAILIICKTIRRIGKMDRQKGPINAWIHAFGAQCAQ